MELSTLPPKGTQGTPMYNAKQLPSAFIWRRIHSLTGLWLVLFLIEHLLTNSQAALWIGDDGNGFVRGVNLIQSLPYLKVIEIFLLGVPILVHLIWGIIYLRTGQLNSFSSDGTTPSLGAYPRNQAYSWQRITSWILIFTVIGHVAHMRFIEYPAEARVDGQHYYMVRLDLDQGLFTLADRLNVKLFDEKAVNFTINSGGLWSSFMDSFQESFFKKRSTASVADQQKQQQEAFLQALTQKPLSAGQVIAVADNFGTAELLVVRETFKMPVMLALYTLLVLAACFHACNGLWTFFITWGINLTVRSQKIFLRVSTALMALLAFLGLAAIWLTYWINLKQ